MWVDFEGLLALETSILDKFLVLFNHKFKSRKNQTHIFTFFKPGLRIPPSPTRFYRALNEKNKLAGFETNLYKTISQPEVECYKNNPTGTHIIQIGR